MAFSADTLAACQVCGEEFKGHDAYLKRARHRKATHPDAVPPVRPTGGSPATQEEEPQVVPPEDVTVMPESAPGSADIDKPTKPALRERFRRKPREKARDTGEVTPGGRAKRRASLEPIATFVWGLGIRAMAGNGYVGTARAMTIESLIVGNLADDNLKGTIVDKALQPVARAAEQGTAFAAVIILPGAVHMIERNPAMAPAMAPVIEMCIDEMLPELAKAIVRAKKKEEQRNKILSELGPMFGKAPGEPATMDDVIRWLVPGPQEEVEP